jgi:hypothetical protein
MLSIIMAAHHAMSAAVSHGGGGRTRLRRGHPGTPGTHRRHAVRNQGHATPVGHPGGSDGVSSAGGPAFTGLRRCWCRLPSGGTRLASISMPSPRRAHPGCTAAGFHENRGGGGRHAHHAKPDLRAMRAPLCEWQASRAAHPRRPCPAQPPVTTRSEHSQRQRNLPARAGGTSHSTAFAPGFGPCGDHGHGNSRAAIPPATRSTNYPADPGGARWPPGDPGPAARKRRAATRIGSNTPFRPRSAARPASGSAHRDRCASRSGQNGTLLTTSTKPER